MLQKQILTVPLAKGLDTKTDEFQVAAGSSLELENAIFYKTGKLQKRFGYSPLNNAGAVVPSGIKSVISDRNLLNVIADNGVYSYSESDEKWSQISEMKDIAKVRSDYLSKSAYNHINPDMDIEQSLGLAAYVYREYEEYTGLTSAVKTFVTIIIEDMTTGLKKIRKISVPATIPPNDKSQQKIMITKDLSGTIHINVFYDFTGYTLRHHVMDVNLEDVGSPATLETFSSGDFFKYKFDVCKDDTYIYFCYMLETSIESIKFNFDGSTVTTSTTTTVLRLGTDPTSPYYGMGFSIAQTTDRLHIFYVSSVGAFFTIRIVGIGLDKSLAPAIAESFTSDFGFARDLAIVGNGTTIHVAATEVQTSVCETMKIDVTWDTDYTFDPAMSVGDLVYRAVIISRPFVYDSSVFVFCKCPEINQNTGLLYNMTTMKFVALFSPFSLSADRLSSQVLATFTTGISNSVIYNGNAYTIAEKSFGVNTNSVGAYDFNANVAAAKITTNFDNSIDSGIKTKIGETNYYTNGTTFALDNRGACETGFFLRPLISTVTEQVSGAATPGIASKNFSYVAVYNFYNGKGELERSTPSPAKAIATTANATYIEVRIKNPAGTFKNASTVGGTTTEKYSVQAIIYRTTNNGTTFYRVGGGTSNFSESSLAYDATSDADLINNEILYTTGGILESDPAPNAKFATAGGNRLFLGGLEEDDEIAFSKKQLLGEMVSFSDFFRIRISSGTVSDRSKLSALGYLDGKLIIFRESSVYYIAGDGPLETGAQDTYTNPEVISSDTGCIEPRSVLNIPTGLIFKSRKGIYLLDRSLQVSYIGSPVEAYNGEGIVSAVVSDKYNEARFYTEEGNCLCYNYLFDAWSVFTGQSDTDANIWAESPIQIIGDDVHLEGESLYLDDSNAYSMKTKTAWLKLSGIQDFGRIWTMSILGKYKSPHILRVKVYYDYATDYSETYDITPSVSDSQYQYRVHLKKQKCEAVQFEIQDLSQSGTGESMELTALTLEVGLKKGSMKLAAARKY